MSRNGQRHSARPRIELGSAMPSSEEAAAITAAVEQFVRDTAPAPSPAKGTQSPWLRAGLLEGTGWRSGGSTRWGA